MNRRRQIRHLVRARVAHYQRRYRLEVRAQKQYAKWSARLGLYSSFVHVDQYRDILIGVDLADGTDQTVTLEGKIGHYENFRIITSDVAK